MSIGQWEFLDHQEMITHARQVRHDFERVQLEKQSAMEEILTKISILRRDFLQAQQYNPIEHVNSRIKSPESTLKKLTKLGHAPTAENIREYIKDMAGVRITCSFIADTYRVMDALTEQHDVRVLEIKDYIAKPKPNGYRSMHAIVETPVHLSDGAVDVVVEIQVRTIAMDFWASLEHKIFYKYDGEIPDHLLHRLTLAAGMSKQLDEQMEKLYSEVRDIRAAEEHPEEPVNAEMLQRLWSSMENKLQTNRPRLRYLR